MAVIDELAEVVAAGAVVAAEVAAGVVEATVEDVKEVQRTLDPL